MLDSRISLLTEFKTALQKWFHRDYPKENEAELRSFINRNLVAVKNAVRDAGTQKRITVAPPRAIGGLVIQNADPFDDPFASYWGYSVIPAAIDSIEQAIGVYEHMKSQLVRLSSDEPSSVRSHSTITPRTKVFISYSHRDERWRQRVVSHLGALDREKLVEVWDDRKIGAGENWFQTIDTQMVNARIAVLLISTDFLTSTFIRDHEVPKLFDRHETAGMTIYPLLIRSCLWQEVPWLSRMQLRPTDAKALSSYRGDKVDEVLTGVAREIAAIARKPGSINKAGLTPH